MDIWYVIVFFFVLGTLGVGASVKERRKMKTVEDIYEGEIVAADAEEKLVRVRYEANGEYYESDMLEVIAPMLHTFPKVGLKVLVETEAGRCWELRRIHYARSRRLGFVNNTKNKRSDDLLLAGMFFLMMATLGLLPMLFP